MSITFVGIASKSSSADLPNNDTVRIWAHIDGQEYELAYTKGLFEFHSGFSSDCNEYNLKWIEKNSQSYNRYTNDLAINRIQSSQAPRIPPYIFVNFCRLKRLTITNQRLTNISEKDFSKSRHLEFLNLSHNAIERLENGVFVECLQLKEIDLSYNQIVYIGVEAFDLETLTDIHLQHNKLAAFDIEKVLVYILVGTPQFTFMDDFTYLIEVDDLLAEDHVIRVDLSNNPLKNSSDCINIHSSTVFDMKMQNVTVQNVFISTWIRYLEAPNNRISSIILEDTNEDFRLFSLNLRNNSLTSISVISKLTNLVEIDLSFNKLESLDAHVFFEFEQTAKYLIRPQQFEK